MGGGGGGSFYGEVDLLGGSGACSPMQLQKFMNCISVKLHLEVTFEILIHAGFLAICRSSDDVLYAYIK